MLINTIGPVWDGNEVWLLVAGGATFAAFPLWYVSLFSGFYLALLVILVALILRGVAFEFRGGFVIIPLMRSDAVDHYHGMTGGQFLNAVALGQITPGPVVQTVAVVGYAAAGCLAVSSPR